MLFGCVGGLGEKETSRGLNRATQAKRQTGSAIKPIAILVPGIDKKIFTASTTFVDEETSFNDGSEEGYHPENYDGYMGEITVRQALETSQNIPFVKMMEEITPKTSIKYLEKMGITTLTEKDENLALALGGLDSGMTPLETAAAYATIANDGKYIEPTFYTRIETSEGKKVLESKQKKKIAISGLKNSGNSLKVHKKGIDELQGQKRSFENNLSRIFRTYRAYMLKVHKAGNCGVSSLV